jgi:mevalonate kinase
VILFGEHAVGYGVPALAVGIDRGAWAESSESSGPASVLHVRGWDVTVTDALEADSKSAPDSPPLARAFAGLLGATREAQRVAGEAPVGTVSIEAEADLPPGGGLGCSAALGVAVARALDASAAAEAIAARVDAWERVFHGNPSGIDVAVSSLGGCVQFTRAPTGAPEIERVRVPVPLHLCVGHSGQSSSTKSMVESVARMRDRRPEQTQRTFDAIHTLVKNARLAIADGDLRAIGQLLDLNQMLLSGLFVSTPEIEQMCGTARTAGALGAKLTGAGGGGCVVALVESAARGAEVLAAWKSEGFDGFAATVKADVQDVLDMLAKRSGVIATAESA